MNEETYTIPLFPLGKVVFPGVSVRLQIFEERYKKMLEYCLDQNEGFGIVLIKEGMEAHGPLAEIHAVGSMVEIIELEKLPDGRFNLNCAGENRFKVIQENRDGEFLRGSVVWLPFNKTGSQKLQSETYNFSDLVKVYIKKIAPEQASVLDTIMFPEETLSQAIFAAEFLQVPQKKKQELLEIENQYKFIQEVAAAFQHELILIDKINELKNSASNKNGEEYLN